MKTLLASFLLSWSLTSYAQLTPYALDSRLQSELIKCFEHYPKVILVDIASCWNDDLTLTGLAENENGRLKRIKVRLQSVKADSMYLLSIDKITLGRVGKQLKGTFQADWEVVNALIKDSVEHKRGIRVNDSDIYRIAPSDGETYSLLHWGTSTALRKLQSYSPQFFQKHIPNSQRQNFMEIVERINR